MSEAMLGRYKRWVNQVSYVNLAKVDPDELVQERTVLFGSMIKVLNHIHAMDRVWQAHLIGEDHGYSTRNPDECPTFSELRKRQAQIDDWYVDYTQRLSSEEAARQVEFEFIGGGPGSLTVSQIITHVAMHGVYHHGHIGTSLREIEADTVTIDLPVFLRFDAAA